MAAAASDLAAAARDVAYEKEWRGFGIAKCQYLAPKEPFVADDGGFDVVFHFNAGQMSEREMRASGTRAVFVSCGFGRGGSGYASAFDDPTRFGSMMKLLAREVGRSAKRGPAHFRKLALVSWSAGFAAVSRILAVPEWYAATDAVILLDSLHAPYVASTPAPANKAAQGADKVDTRSLSRFIQFARDAAAGTKTMVVTHTSIVPPDYASSAEATAAVLKAIDVAPRPVTDGTPDARKMLLAVRVDAGNLHVRGFRGGGPHDHFDHLHLIGDALRSWIVPRWYTPGGERL